MTPPDRYHRQQLLPMIGEAGQRRLREASIVLVGCGALGTAIADQLVRGGVGRLRIIDRDVVELTNLQRQVLFDESDARDGLPKAVAAARRLEAVNSQVSVEPVVADVHSGNVEELCRFSPLPPGEGVKPDLILDGTDNAETRYLLNDVAVKHGIPWVYGACVGTEGRMMLIRPGATACLRCAFPEPPAPGELPTCDTAGVLGPAAGVVASLQSAASIALIAGADEMPAGRLVSIDVRRMRFRHVSTEKRADCITCGRRCFEFLERVSSGVVSLCGRNAVQVRPTGSFDFQSQALDEKLRTLGEVERSRYLLRCHSADGIVLTVFPDGRMLVHGTSDLMKARSIYARYVGV